MKKNKELLVVTHLSQLLDFVTGIGGFVIPLILWVLKRDEVLGMDTHGRAILNFRISMFLYFLLCVPIDFILQTRIARLCYIRSVLYYFSNTKCYKSE